MKNRPNQTISDEFFHRWYLDWCIFANEVTFKFSEFDPKESYRKHFKKAIDFYEQTDEYLKIELVFRELINLRERCAARLDISPQRLLTEVAVLILARQKPMSGIELDALLNKFSIINDED